MLEKAREEAWQKTESAFKAQPAYLLGAKPNPRRFFDDGYSAGYQAAQPAWRDVKKELPIYEDLPQIADDDPHLLITRANGKVMEVCFGETFYSLCDESKIIKDAIAWSLMPEPFQGGRDKDA